MRGYAADTYSSLHNLYAGRYRHDLVSVREVRSSGAAMLHARHTGGEWTDGPIPELIVGLSLKSSMSVSRSAFVDLGAGRFKAPVRRGTIFVAPPNAVTMGQVADPYELIFLGIPYGSLTGLAQFRELGRDGDFGRVHEQAVEDPFLAQLLQRLWEESADGSPHGALFADGALVTLTASLLRLAGRHPAPSGGGGGLAAWQVRRSSEQLSSQLSEELRLADVAKEVGLTPYHFARAFKRSVGVPPYRYRMKLRLEKACCLLETTALSVTEIAFEIGYESPQAFARVFVRELGMPPSAWRRHRAG